MANQLLITKKDGAVLSVRVEDGKVAQIQAQPEDAGSLLGDIYVGKVRNIVKNINAAFVEYHIPDTPAAADTPCGRCGGNG